MANAEQVTTAALQEILEQADEAPLESADYNAAIFYMNNYMAQLAALGVNLGYTIVTSLKDEITIPDGALTGLIKNLALQLAPQFDSPVTLELRQAAKIGENAMRSIAVQLNNTYYPSTLPIGSGNEGDWQQNWHFYPEQGTNILGEQTSPILVETETEEDV